MDTRDVSVEIMDQAAVLRIRHTSPLVLALDVIEHLVRADAAEVLSVDVRTPDDAVFTVRVPAGRRARRSIDAEPLPAA